MRKYHHYGIPTTEKRQDESLVEVDGFKFYSTPFEGNKKMHTLQVTFRKFPEEDLCYFGYGLGWKVGMLKGHYIVSHGGEIDGFTSSIALLPKEKMGVVVLTNIDNQLVCINSLAETILVQILREIGHN